MTEIYRGYKINASVVTVQSRGAPQWKPIARVLWSEKGVDHEKGISSDKRFPSIAQAEFQARILARDWIDQKIDQTKRLS